MSDKTPNGSSNRISDPFRAGQAEAIWELFRTQKEDARAPERPTSGDTGANEKSDRKPSPDEDTWFLVFSISLGLGLWSLDAHGASRAPWLFNGAAASRLELRIAPAALAGSGSGPTQVVAIGGLTGA